MREVFSRSTTKAYKRVSHMDFRAVSLLDVRGDNLIQAIDRYPSSLSSMELWRLIGTGQEF